MKSLALFAAAMTASLVAAPAAENEPPLFEMRTYYAAPGKLDDLNLRFRAHTTALFAKHGMTNVGYWMPIQNPENKLVFVLRYPGREAREASWKAFLADPDWKQAQAASEQGGKLVAKVEQVFMTPTDYSPPGRLAAGEEGGVFELRTYTATPGKLPLLHERFRQHTMDLFSKHGMRNLWYWQLEKGQPGADHTLIYFLAHPSVEAAAASFAAFRADPVWIEAKTASEKSGGGSLTVPEGVKSVLLKATDYSPVK